MRSVGDCIGGPFASAMRLIYKPNCNTYSAPPYPLQDFKALYKCCIIIIIIIIVIIIYRRIWFTIGLRSRFAEWPAGSVVSVLSCELNGQGSSPAWAIFSVTFHFQLNYGFFVGRLGLVGLAFSIRVSVTV